MPNALIRLENVTRVYAVGKRQLYALRDVSLEICSGEFVAITGPSGSGKSTLLSLIGGIDKPDMGRVWVGDHRIDLLDENTLAKWRGGSIGIVFQFFQLLPTLTALENVMLPMELRNTFANHRRQRAIESLTLVGLADRTTQLPSELSGGEQQRVALARALANDPPILLADEPTGNLDSDTGRRIIDLLLKLNHSGKTIVLVTHEEELACAARRVVRVRDGHIVT
ncbi:MAG: ABC transporter ATP-binding protein [Chloroflexi bacterium]|nr:ABC transporter ATP-binding protein [Chloroflexota bacterium]